MNVNQAKYYLVLIIAVVSLLISIASTTIGFSRTDSSENKIKEIKEDFSELQNQFDEINKTVDKDQNLITITGYVYKDSTSKKGVKGALDPTDYPVEPDEIHYYSVSLLDENYNQIESVQIKEDGSFEFRINTSKQENIKRYTIELRSNLDESFSKDTYSKKVLVPEEITIKPNDTNQVINGGTFLICNWNKK